MAEAKTKNLPAVISFFVLEVIALVAFTFTGSFLVYGLFGMFLFVILGLFTYDEWKKNGSLQFLIFAIPLIIYALLTALSNFSRSAIDLGNNLITFIGLVSFLFIGYLTNFVKSFKIKYALLALYGGVFLILAISFIYTLVYYTPFYTLIFKKMYYYYDGSRYLLSKSINFLIGFSFEEVPLQYFSMFSTILFSSILGLKFISPKKEPRLFVIYLLFGLFGFISLIFFPTIETIITTVLIILLYLFLLFAPKEGKTNKGIQIAFYIVIGLCLLGVLFIFLNAQQTQLTAFIKQNRILNKLFNTNHIVKAYNDAAAGMFNGKFLFGHQASFNSDGSLVGLLGGVNGNEIISTYSNSWLFDSFYSSGIFGVIAISAFVIFTYFMCIRYYKKSKDSLMDKTLILGLIWTFFIYTLFNAPFIGQTHKAMFVSIFRNGFFLIILFFIGYIYTPRDAKKKEEVLLNETTN